jgi:hypothetical protein
MQDFLKKKLGEERFSTVMTIIDEASDPLRLITMPTSELVKAITDEDAPVEGKSLQRLKDCLKIIRSILHAQIKS